MKQVLVLIGYSICLLFELPMYIKQDRKKLVLYSILMVLSLIETMVIISFKDLPSFASIIQKIFEPISNEIFGS